MLLILNLLFFVKLNLEDVINFLVGIIQLDRSSVIQYSIVLILAFIEGVELWIYTLDIKARQDRNS